MQLTLKQLKQVFIGLGAGLALLFVVHTVTGLQDAHNQVREIPVLIARVEKLESVVTTLAESQIATKKSQQEVVEITGQLQEAVFLLTRIAGKTVGVEPDGD
jgi:hypothetical protein